MRNRVSLLVAGAVSLLASTAVASPVLTALAAPRGSPIVADCAARPPAAGEAFSGTVLQVIDGHTLCVAQGAAPDAWIRVTIAGAGPRTQRSTLMAASFGRALVCVSTKATATGAEARCAVDGAALDQLIHTDAMRREGLSWR